MYKIHKNRPNKKYDLVVRGIPFGGHINGKDADGEFFHANTSISTHPVPIMYAHGNQIDTPESRKGQVYGVTEDIWQESDGFYYGVKIFDDAEVEDYNGQKHKAKDYFRQSANDGMLFSSIGSLRGANLQVDKSTGSIDKVVVAELSLIDKRLTPTVSPRNYYAVARTKAKENYLKAGIIDEKIIEEEKINGVCKCGCGFNSDSLFEDETEKCEDCTTDNPCQKCNIIKNKPNKGEGMNFFQKLKALMEGKKDGEEVTKDELESILKGGETKVVTTDSTNIGEIVKSAIEVATKPLMTEIENLKTQFSNDITTLKATQETNSFNKYLSQMLNVKLSASEVAEYQNVYATLDKLDSATREGVVTTLKAQIEAKTPIADLVAMGVRVLDNDDTDAQETAIQETAFVASVAMKAGSEVFGSNKEANDNLQAIAKKAMDAVNAGGAK